MKPNLITYSPYHAHGRATISRQLYVLLAVLATAICIHHADAQVPFYDGFNYTAAQPLGKSGNGIWQNSVAAVSIVSGSLDGTSLGLAASTGNMVTIAGGTGGFGSSFTKGDFNGGTDITDANYFSFLLKLTDATGIDTSGDGTPIINFNHAGSNSKVLTAILLYNNAGHVTIGVAKYPGNATPNATGFVASGAGSAIEDGNTYLVVGKLQVNPGNANDTVSLWVNPVSLGGGEDPLPQVNAIGGGLPDDGGGIGRVFVPAGYNASIDELRIGTSWAEVTPSSGQPPVSLRINNASLNGDAFSISGSGGTPDGNYNVLTSPNIALPTAGWTVSGPFQFDGGGNFNFSNPVSPGQSPQFYRIQTP